jgi:hypothetical protein
MLDHHSTGEPPQLPTDLEDQILPDEIPLELAGGRVRL